MENSQSSILVSIAMATYNGEKYLVEQLDSIINQTHKNIELIIIDDCSIDGTVEVIQSYQKRYPFIRLHQNPVNLGIVKSFEKSINLCSGDYIALSDQDDIWCLNKIEVLLRHIGNNLLIHSDAALIHSDGTNLASSHFMYSKKPKNNTFYDYLLINNVTGCTTLFSKELVQIAFPIPDDFYIHDHYLALIASFYNRIFLLDEQLVYYRQHSNNIIGASRLPFEKFLENSKVKSDSYNSLLNKVIFQANWMIELSRDYRLSLYKGKWSSKYSIFKLLRLPQGVKLLLYFLALAGFKNRNISKHIYNFIYKIPKN